MYYILQSYHIISYVMILYQIISYHIMSYHITLHHIVSNHASEMLLSSVTFGLWLLPLLWLLLQTLKLNCYSCICNMRVTHLTFLNTWIKKLLNIYCTSFQLLAMISQRQEKKRNRTKQRVKCYPILLRFVVHIYCTTFCTFQQDLFTIPRSTQA